MGPTHMWLAAVCGFRGNPSPAVVVGVGFVCWVVVFGLGGFSFAGFYFGVDEISTPCLHVSRRQPGCIACGPDLGGFP